MEIQLAKFQQGNGPGRKINGLRLKNHKTVLTGRIKLARAQICSLHCSLPLHCTFYNTAIGGSTDDVYFNL